MQQVEKKVMHKGELIATVVVDQAESWKEAQELAGGTAEALELFNRAWTTYRMNQERPGREATGAKKIGGVMKKLSPEIRQALAGKSEEELLALLSKVGLA